VFTVKPPEIVTVAPLTNPVPVMITFVVVLCVTETGLAVLGDVTVGAAFTVKQFVQEPTPASGFVTVAFPAPVVAFPATVMFAVSDVAETNDVEFTVIPKPENVAVAPFTNPVPVMVMDWLVAP
jgi:hypothetical protein